MTVAALFADPFFYSAEAVYFAQKIFLGIIKPSFVFAAGWLTLITLLLCIPGTKLPKVQWHDKIWLDKWIHVFLFLVLVFLWCKAHIIKTKKIFLIITVLCIVYGISMELVQQYLIPFRFFDLRDVIANSLGAIAGYFISANRLITNQ